MRCHFSGRVLWKQLWAHPPSISQKKIALKVLRERSLKPKSNLPCTPMSSSNSCKLLPEHPLICHLMISEPKRPPKSVTTNGPEALETLWQRHATAGGGRVLSDLPRREGQGGCLDATFSPCLLNNEFSLARQRYEIYATYVCKCN